MHKKLQKVKFKKNIQKIGSMHCYGLFQFTVFIL